MKPILDKTNLHPRNQHRAGYDYDKLVTICPQLSPFVFINEFHSKTIDFSNPQAVKTLNAALLNEYYQIHNWNIPPNYLCPPVPGRVDYIHYIADLLASSNNNVIPKGETIQVLDIGVGANCIYPIIGNTLYGWSFVGTDIDEIAIQNCRKIIQNNPQLMDGIGLQLQTQSNVIFKNIITPEDRFDVTICNPPFHKSLKDANSAAIRKVNALEKSKITNPILNFGGQNAELWCEGGELAFITQMIFESVKFPLQCLWFTTLVSKKEHLNSLYKTLNKVNVASIKTINMAQGQKTSRILAWTFQTDVQQKKWKFDQLMPVL